jgi:hypothetical protein
VRRSVPPAPLHPTPSSRPQLVRIGRNRALDSFFKVRRRPGPTRARTRAGAAPTASLTAPPQHAPPVPSSLAPRPSAPVAPPYPALPVRRQGLEVHHQGRSARCARRRRLHRQASAAGVQVHQGRGRPGARAGPAQRPRSARAAPAQRPHSTHATRTQRPHSARSAQRPARRAAGSASRRAASRVQRAAQWVGAAAGWVRAEPPLTSSAHPPLHQTLPGDLLRGQDD